jgi:Flp pilus assembly protein TadG
MKRLLLSLVHDRSAAAAVEMALVLPFLMALLFGAMDVGDYFLSEHVVQKAVRDASRYAARLPMTNYDCSATPPSVDSTAESDIQHVARYGDPDGTTARLIGWTDDTMATVTLTCDTNTSDTYVNNGVYNGFPDGGAVPVITVSATVPYNTFFGMLGLGALTLNLNAKSQSAVTGA